MKKPNKTHTLFMSKFNSTFIATVILLTLNGCIPPKALFLGHPDHKDLGRFPSRDIMASNDCFEFKNNHNFDISTLKVNDWATDIPFFKSVDQLVNEHPVRSFLIIQNDEILYEYYGEGAKKDDLHPSYSIAKSFTSALLGIAIDEGYISNEKDLVLKYLPDLKGAKEMEFLTLEHLLNHTSGIKYDLAIDAHIYYGKNIYNGVKKITFSNPPGTIQHYLNINIQLLGLVIYQATGKYPSEYLQEKIWQPIGMCSDAVWTIDAKNNMEKTFCCLGATAMDYAKFGRLFLHKGRWNGTQIFSEAWYEKSIRRNTDEGSSYNYNYCWHIGLKAYGDFMANGLYKQNIYIHPEKELIIVLLKNKEKLLRAERTRWEYIFRQIADQL